MSSKVYDCYCQYTALKAHFSTNYDYLKYNGKLKSANPAAFNSSNLKLFFQKLAKHSDVQGFLVANFLEDSKAWIRDLAYSDRAEAVYTEWAKRVQSLTYIFTQEIKKLDEDNFNENFIIKNGGHPLILKLYLRKEISLETLTILVDLSGCDKYFNKVLKSDPIWEDIGFKISKYKPFLTYDREKTRKILLDKYKSME